MIYVTRNNITIPSEERVLGHYGDHCMRCVEFNIDENGPKKYYILYILFSDGSINSILLDQISDNTAVWNIQAKHIFASGIAYIQIKAIGEYGEIWHSPKGAVEFRSSIEESDTAGSYTPSIFERVDLLMAELLNSNQYITREDALAMITQSIDELILPLDRRLDGEV